MKVNQTNIPEFLSGGGEMGERIRNFDWTKTPLGPPENWEQSLKTCVRIMLTSSQPIWIGWGEQLIKLYNDPYKAIVGGKHPEALGQPAAKVWREIWNDIEPMLRQVMQKNEGTYVERQLLIMERNGYPEETYYTFSYTPVPGDKGGTAGMFCANTDDTSQVISERQLATLTDLGKNLLNAADDSEVYRKAMEVFQQQQKDFPFAVLYQVIPESHLLLRRQKAPMALSDDFALPQIDAKQSDPLTGLAEMLRTGQPVVVDELRKKTAGLPSGPWHDSPDKVFMLPIAQSHHKTPYGVLCVGVNPYRQIDEKYKSFFQLIADQIATAIANVHALDEERKRAAALEELDKSKTIFFSNISHEFRTPLTLMLSPLEDLMNTEHINLKSRERQSIETTHRNALRLLKLVNTLLDFSRIESGRQKANYSSVELGSFTKNLAANFQSVIEKAGLEFIVTTHKMPQSVYVDRLMWEKIVFNLLSNAFKYTLSGRITLRLFSENDHAVLEVEDTGTGIPEKELPRMFERFHRVQNTTGRTYEGTGIGLSLVKELVGLHGGAIGVESQEHKGTLFRVRIPLGKEHLPDGQISEHETYLEDVVSDVYVKEASGLLEAASLKNRPVMVAARQNGSAKSTTVLVVDDNADMREHLQALLQKNYRVITAANGAEALEMLKSAHPALILSDIMMPVMDGIQLLKAVKNDAQTAQIPLILLTARAGEESKIEGYETGADDYLVKPFSAKELLARVHSQIKLANTRKHIQQQLKNTFLQAPTGICVLRGSQYIVEVANEKMLDIWGKSAEQMLNRPVFEAMPDASGQGFEQILDTVYATGKSFVIHEAALELLRRGISEKVYLKFVFEPFREEDGRISGIIAVADEITDLVKARQEIEESEKRFRNLAETLPHLVWVAAANGEQTYASSRWKEYTGVDPVDEETWREMVHPADLEKVNGAWQHSLTTGTPYKCEVRLKSRDGEYRWYSGNSKPVFEGDKIVKWVGAFTDVHTEKSFAQELEKQVENRTKELAKAKDALEQKNEELEKMNQELESFAYVSSHDLQEPLRKIQTFSSRILEIENNLSPAGLDYFSRIQGAAKRMQVLIEDLIAFSRINTGERKFEPVNLKTIVEEIKTEFRETILEKNAVVHVDEMCDAQIIPFQFRQLMQNLLGNALKFTVAERSPIITVKSSIVDGTDLLHEKLSPQKKYCHISVSDNGIGFEPRFNKRIFEVFQRLHGREAYQGTGIGLAIVKKIVENHNGIIAAKGMVNQGATFDIYIPHTETDIVA